MYCSISDAWSQENTMANLAQRFNKEYFDNVPHQMEYFKVDDDIVKGNDFSDKKYGNIAKVQNIDNIPKVKEIPKNLDTNLVDQIIKENKTEIQQPEIKEIIKYKEYSCKELIDKVLSCEICKKMIIEKLNINGISFSKTINNLLSGSNKEVIILILIGLIIIILLDLFLRISSSLN